MGWKHLTSVILFFCCFTISAEPEVSEEFSYYLIYPNSPAEIATELTKNSPIKENGRIFRGHTDWHVRWNFWWDTSNGQCKINKANTTVKVTYTMPKLSDQHKDKLIVERFNDYYLALLQHEKGHKGSGVLAAKEIEEVLLALPAKTDCKILESLANKKAKTIIRKYNKRDMVYDYKTDHGRTQGATIN